VERELPGITDAVDEPPEFGAPLLPIPCFEVVSSHKPTIAKALQEYGLG
jgi:hypothetical protein